MEAYSRNISAVKSKTKRDNKVSCEAAKRSASCLFTCVLSAALVQQSQGLLTTPGSHLYPFGLVSNPKTLKKRSRTRSWYRNGDSYDSQERRKEHADALQPYLSSQDEAKWWGSIFSRSQHHGHPTLQKQDKMDKYLEFLDRRYNRLHSEDVSKSKSDQGKTNSPWSWLFEPSSDSNLDRRSFAQMQDDALYILGVAELASEKLLQKHLCIKENHENDSSHEKQRPKHFLSRIRSSRDSMNRVLQKQCTNVFTNALLVWGNLFRTVQKQKYRPFSLGGIVFTFLMAKALNIFLYP